MTQGAITVVPGQTRPLIQLANDYPTGTVVRVLVLGATQHPATTYAYEADGAGFSLPFPLGTVIHPIYTCHHLGAYLEFQDTFSIAVTNNGTKPHRYAAIVISEPTVSKY
jgi:hypothetical protein